LLKSPAAVPQGKSVHGLETVDELVAALDGLSVDDQIEILVDTVCNRDQLTGQLEELTTLYLRQNVAAMLAINAGSHQDEALFGRFMERTLYRRNRRMALRIRDWLGGEGTPFIAVGALHWPVKGAFCAIWRPLVIGFHEYSDILAATPPQVVIRCRSVLPP